MRVDASLIDAQDVPRDVIEQLLQVDIPWVFRVIFAGTFLVLVE